ncbi:MAG TPA: Spx/MgsR family RNA polymerase-binding regulatory protein [Gammaproteobacteria bacterium]
MILYGLKNCDSCRKARKWLDANGLEYDFIDVRDDVPSVHTLKAWHAALGDGLLNRRGTTWRQLSDAEKARAENALPALLQDHPALIKRPVLVNEHKLLSGFDENTWRKALM